jgi:hypothetical protein
MRILLRAVGFIVVVSSLLVVTCAVADIVKGAVGDSGLIPVFGGLIGCLVGGLMCSAGNRRDCPSCSEGIKAAARICPYCRTPTNFA